MFNQLLKALFGADTPLAPVPSTQVQWAPWLQDIRPEMPVGDDPGYEDEFLAIKDEVAKLSGVNDALIVEVSERLLKTMPRMYGWRSTTCTVACVEMARRGSRQDSSCCRR
ncbi:type VI secretion system protein VasJ [Ralstonia sp. 25mfcol4.1]|nr:type VI secretion system protein VasJ [Ralstonia sp. 25mfcol4.1]